MGLGAFPDVSLAAARAAALHARGLIAQCRDPLEARREAEKANRPVPTFGDIAALVIADAQKKTANAKVAYQWERHLGPVYSGPLLQRPVNEITTMDVAAVLRPVWRSKPEVARKLYPAIRRVFEYARIRLRDEHGVNMPDNPARWDDLKAMGFEAPIQLSRGRHSSLSYEEMPVFMAALRAREATAARLLEFLILTNVRTGAALAAKWDEFNLEAAIWAVPVINLKDKRHRKEAFRVPLSARALDILREMQVARVSDHVFPGSRGKPLSNMAMLTLLKRMKNGGEQWLDPTSGRPIVPHGFRATFRTWCEETVHFPHAVIEEAMGHVVGTAVERAYRRTDVLEQRRALMAAWTAHCEPRKGGNIIPLTSRHG
jgi:integrase